LPLPWQVVVEMIEGALVLVVGICGTRPRIFVDIALVDIHATRVFACETPVSTSTPATTAQMRAMRTLMARVRAAS
jgi:hypothetical protein